MTVIRRPLAAGLFYPAHPDELAETVDRLLAAAPTTLLDGQLHALVAPHAGYLYSGAVAAAAFAAVPRADGPLRVALFGPSHFAPLVGAAVSAADAWATPLGEVPVDDELRTTAVEAGAVVDERPHRDDHALEVELPFLQRRRRDCLRVLPVAIGDTDAGARVAAALAAESLLVVSTDLSHYYDDETACRLDRRTAEAVLSLDADAIGDLDACGAAALRALVRCAQREQWACTLLDLRTSAEASGDLHRVVGYGAFAFTVGSRR